VAGPTRKQIATLFNTSLWLKWQAQCRISAYRSDVAQFLHDLRRDVAELTSQQQALQERGKAWITSQIADIDTLITTDMEIRDRLDACRRVLLAYRHVKSHLRQFEADLTPKERHDLDNCQGSRYAEINHAIMNVIAPCLAQAILDQIPALAHFATQWSLRFPLPPTWPWVITELFRDTVPVSVVSVDEARRTVLLEAQLDTDFPLQVVTDFFELHYAAYSPKHRSRWGGASARRLQPLAHYREVFHVYDLRKRGLSFPAIAWQLWPEEFAKGQRPYPAKNLAVQKAQDHFKTAEHLIGLK
jgi:hypothetical protein